MSNSDYSISMSFPMYIYESKLENMKISKFRLTAMHLLHLEKRQQHVSYSFVLFLESPSKLSGCPPPRVSKWIK